MIEPVIMITNSNKARPSTSINKVHWVAWASSFEFRPLSFVVWALCAWFGSDLCQRQFYASPSSLWKSVHMQMFIKCSFRILGIAKSEWERGSDFYWLFWFAIFDVDYHFVKRLCIDDGMKVILWKSHNESLTTKVVLWKSYDEIHSHIFIAYCSNAICFLGIFTKANVPK